MNTVARGGDGGVVVEPPPPPHAATMAAASTATATRDAVLPVDTHIPQSLRATGADVAARESNPALT
jgi:hypothetical protein